MREKSNKKILYLVTKSVWGGAQKYVCDLSSAARDAGYEVLVAAGGLGPLKEKTEFAGIPYRSIKHFTRDIRFLADPLALLEVYRLIEKSLPDVVHVSSPKAGGLAGLALWLLKLRRRDYTPHSVFTVHGWSHHEDRPRWQKFLIRVVSRLTCSFYDVVICVSHFDYGSALRYRIVPRRKLFFIHNGIDEKDYPFLSRETARQTIRDRAKGLEKETLWVGTIGEFTKNKGHEYLVAAVDDPKIDSHRLQTVIIGFGENIKTLEDLIEKRSLRKKVFLLDNLPRAALYLKAFDIFVLPSIKEGLPYVLLEATLAGVPTIAAQVGGVPEVVIREKTGLLVPPRESAALARAIAFLATHPQERERLGEAALHRVKTSFNQERMIRKTFALYAPQ